LQPASHSGNYRHPYRLSQCWQPNVTNPVSSACAI